MWNYSRFSPNPATNQINVDFNLPRIASIRLNLFDLIGKHVKSILDNVQFPAGHFSYSCDVSDLAEGVYIVKFSSENYSKNS